MTGVSVIDIHPERFDEGAVLLQEEVPVQAEDTATRFVWTAAEGVLQKDTVVGTAAGGACAGAHSHKFCGRDVAAPLDWR